MTKYLFSYRMPKDYKSGRPETVAAWTAWFESMGTSLVDRGHGVIEPSALGKLGAGTRRGGTRSYPLTTPKRRWHWSKDVQRWRRVPASKSA
jgi:hypothetical protein